MLASPFSNWPPTILSMLMNRQNALAMKMNSVVLVASKGFVKSSLILIRSLGRLSVIVMLPSPTSLLPDHLKIAPVPAAGASNEFLAAGSSFAHGDHASHL